MSRRTQLLAILALSLPLLDLGSANAAEPWEGKPMAGDPAAIASAAAKLPTPAGVDVVTLLEETTYRFDNNGQLHFTWRKVFKILTAKGARDWEVISTQWSPWFQSKPIISARAISPDGKVTIMPASSVTTAPVPASPQVSGHRREVKGSLPAMAPGVVIEEMITRRQSTRHQPGGSSYQDTFTSTSPSSMIRLIIDAPTNLKLRHRSWQLEARPKIRRKGGRLRVVYARHDVKPKGKPENMLPRSQTAVPQVVFSIGSSWKAVARGQRAAIVRALAQGLPAGVRVKQGRDRAETLANALAMLHSQVKDSKLGRWQSPAQPRSPADTWNSKLGDSVDMSTLLVALLASAGIEAQVALAHDGGGLDTPRALPGAGLFTYALVVVPGKTRLWIEPTIPEARAGELPSFYRDRNVLILAPGTTSLTKTPAANERENRIHELREIYLADQGKARVVETATYSGHPERVIRRDYAKVNAVELRKRLSSYAEDQYLADAGATSSWSSPTDLSKLFRIKLEATGSARADCGNDTCDVFLPLTALFDKVPTIVVGTDGAKAASARKRDYLTATPHTYRLEYRVHIPDGWRLTAQPANEKVDLGGASFHSKLTRAGRTLTASYELRQHRHVLTPDRLRSFRKQALALYGRSPVKLTLQHVSTAKVHAGKIPDALSELRRLAAAQPKNSSQRWRMIDILMNVGLREPALEEAQKAVAIDGSAVSYGYLGWVLTHDALARQYRPGHDHDGAIKALRKAVALNPEYDWAHGQLGDVLERNAKGHRFAGDLEAAAKTQRRAYELDKTKYAGLIDTLAASGRWVEAREIAEKDGGPQARAMAVAATAVIEGPGPALARARKNSAQSPGTMIDGALALLLMFNDYPALRALRDHAAKAGIPSGMGAAQRAMFARLKPWKKLLYRKRDPRRAIQLELAQSFGLAGGAKARKKNLSRSALALEPDQPGGIWSQAHSGLYASRFSPETLFNATLAAFTITIAERKPWGVRIELAASNKISQAYVIREHGRFKLLSLDWAAPLGAHALSAARRGDLKAARGWLEWAVSAQRAQNLSEPYQVLWTEENGANRDALARNAAALLVGSALTRRALPYLDGCPDSNAKVASACADSMAHAAFKLQDAKLMRRAVASLDQHRPTRDHRLTYRSQAASVTGDWAPVLALARQVLKSSPKDHQALAAEATALCARTTAEGCHRLLLSASQRSGGDELKNMLAWQALTAGIRDPATLLAAQEGVQHARHHASLNTLAAVQAARGQTTAAYATLTASVAMRDFGEPNAADWLIQGRIAAACGYPALARKQYKRVKKEAPFTAHIGTWDLAQRWLKDLQAP